MEVGYINGELCFVFYEKTVPSGERVLESNEILVYKHRDIVLALNNLLKRIEYADDSQLSGEHLTMGGLPTRLWVILSQFKKVELPWVIKESAVFSFDAIKKVKRVGRPPLQHHDSDQIKNAGEIKVLKGGRKPPEAMIYYDALSAKGKAFIKELQGQTQDGKV
jgi:hypothetical protein